MYIKRKKERKKETIEGGGVGGEGGGTIVQHIGNGVDCIVQKIVCS